MRYFRSELVLVIKKGCLLLLGISLFFSCITTHKVKEIDNFRIETDNNYNEESFVFKPEMLPGEAKSSLRKQFGLTEDQKLSDFETKLFDDIDTKFTIKISFEVDREVTTYYTPLLYGEDAETMIGNVEAFVKIIVLDVNGNNCLSQKSLFCNKMKSFLIEIKNTIKKEKYYNISTVK